MIVKLTASAFALLLLASWAPEGPARLSTGQTGNQPPLVVAGQIGLAAGSTDSAEADSEVLVPDPEPADYVVEWVDAAELHSVKSPTLDTPYFVAEPEDPTKVRFIAEPEDPNLVCLVQVSDGHVNFCDITRKPHPIRVPGYEPAP